MNEKDFVLKILIAIKTINRLNLAINWFLVAEYANISLNEMYKNMLNLKCKDRFTFNLLYLKLGASPRLEKARNQIKSVLNDEVF